MIIVGKSMPIDNYEQYKRVINQTTGRLYILETKKYIFLFYLFIICLVCVWLFITICFWSIYKVDELHDFIWFGMVLHKDSPENEKRKF